MSYGAMLTDSAGVPFYIGDTMPLTLLEKRVLSVPASSGTGTVINLFNNDGVIRFIFVNSNGAQGNAQSTCEALELSGGVWSLRCAGATRTVSVYIFGYQFQPIPAWGIQINDPQGRCILTNETKVLRDVQKLGDEGSDAGSGFTANFTLNGEWAVAPAYTGSYVGTVSQGGQVYPVVAQYASSARFNGSTTQITSGYIGNLNTGGGGTGTLTNYRNRLVAVNVQRY
ncbi:hypothetical protein [Pantoea agglomerans]|uniref:hypothetical protein n=1 Tax=Enterobacter agglomerans TaxID=549 RepID=UPI0028978F65|nr:hypothetical protein [Pantoea agglomerans]WNK36861.1 hypothetical protein RM158_08600 [Pantoea agglomerans]